MVRLSSTVAAALLAASVTAQSGDDNVKIWAAAAYINHGEKTPSLGTLQEVLTPEGAQQMWRQGRAFRARYLNATEDLSDAEIEVAGSSPIQGIEGKAINNEQVDITAGEDEWVVGGALAFFQGLYPPVTNSYNSLAGGEDLARNLSANGSDTIEFPLNGYQYPLLQTLSSLDSESPGYVAS